MSKTAAGMEQDGPAKDNAFERATFFEEQGQLGEKPKECDAAPIRTDEKHAGRRGQVEGTPPGCESRGDGLHRRPDGISHQPDVESQPEKNRDKQAGGGPTDEKTEVFAGPLFIVSEPPPIMEGDRDEAGSERGGQQEHGTWIRRNLAVADAIPKPFWFRADASKGGTDRAARIACFEKFLIRSPWDLVRRLCATRDSRGAGGPSSP
jgi:hypothetical protein